MLHMQLPKLTRRIDGEKRCIWESTVTRLGNENTRGSGETYNDLNFVGQRQVPLLQHGQLLLAEVVVGHLWISQALWALSHLESRTSMHSARSIYRDSVRQRR